MVSGALRFPDVALGGLEMRRKRLGGGNSKLARVRRRQGLSQVEAARRAGIPPTTWSTYERGLRSPTLRQLRKFAAALGVRVEDLID